MIKTTIEGEALERALTRHQAWVDRQTAGVVQVVEDLRRDRARELVALQGEQLTLRRRLRMAKADVRPEPR